ncbi:MAG: site-2 protease family protein [Chloroflexi bacterium]|nr:site-2 protease family protein [Chloroflexota bacterium]
MLAGITVHEASHALVAFRLGDYTAKSLGRLSLNPIRHLDPMGTIMLVFVGFGWGKPVPVNPFNVAGGRKGLAIVSAAGPVSNLLAASLFALPFKLGLLSPGTPFSFFSPLDEGVSGVMALLFRLAIQLNLVLAVFNFIPIFPLDGSKVVLGLLPEQAARRFARLEPYGPVILISVLALDAFTHIGLLSRVLIPVVNYLGKIILGVDVF